MSLQYDKSHYFMALMSNPNEKFKNHISFVLHRNNYFKETVLIGKSIMPNEMNQISVNIFLTLYSLFWGLCLLIIG